MALPNPIEDFFNGLLGRDVEEHHWDAVVDSEGHFMGTVRTGWPQVRENLQEGLLTDPYVVWNLRQTDPSDDLVVSAPSDARNVMRVYPHSPCHDVWLEAHSNEGRSLLRELPSERRIFLTAGTPVGLRLIQEEFSGIVSLGGVFCFTDRDRFRPAFVHEALRLGPEDREPLQGCDGSLDLSGFDAGSDRFYGSYDGGGLVGYAWAWSSDRMAEVHVHVRPERRRHGYGRSIVSAATQDMLGENDVVFYHAVCEENLASLRLCLAVGFAPLRVTSLFDGTRRP